MHAAKHFALLAYNAAISDIAELQQRIALRRAVLECHGKQTVPLYPHEFRRRMMLYGQDLLTNPEHVVSEAQSDAERLHKLLPIAVKLERMFTAHPDADNETWIAVLSNFLRTEGGD